MSNGDDSVNEDGVHHEGFYSQPEEVLSPSKPPSRVLDTGTPAKQQAHDTPSFELASSPEPTPTRTPLKERLKRNKKRNEAKLAELGLAFGIKPRPKKQPRLPSSPQFGETVVATIEQQEELSGGRESLSLENISKKFPCRLSQVTELYCLLQRCPEGGPSIFVTGPRGSGKTAVVRDFLQSIGDAAYVDCTSLSVSNSNSDADLFSRIYVQHTGLKEPPSPARQSVWNLHLALQRHARLHRLTVLDHAERVDMSTLLQFLLLPNTQMVLISRSNLLPYAERMNTASPTATVHFGAYRTSAALKEILLCQSNQKAITGAYELNRFECQAYPAFLDTLLQSLLDLTSDVRDYVGLGRRVWPRYTEPLRPHRIKDTLQGQHRLSVREVLSVLDQKILPVLRKEMQCIGQSPVRQLQDNTSVPMNVYFLVLAAYICQRNHPDRDRQLFLIQKNGRRSGRKQEAADVPPPDRPRSFPCERLYSIYVSLIHLHGSGMGSGSIEFFQTIRFLIDMEILQESRARTFAGSITQGEAHSIALVVNVPLEQYTA